MSKAVMLSIQPKWCELIASGKKTVEVRKTHPKLETPFKCYIYCTANKNGVKDLLEIHGNDGKIRKANGKIIGEFICDKIEVLKRNEIFNAPALYSQSRLTREEYFNYIGNKTTYIWYIAEPKIYDLPKELSEFRKSGALNYDDWLYGLYNGTTESTYEKYLFPFTLTRPPQSWCYVEEISGA